MVEKNVFLKTEQDAVDFAEMVSRDLGDIRLVFDNSTIDAKSVLCVLGMGLGKKGKLRIVSPNANEIVQKIAPYICTE